jgi:hypothetical protein
MNANEEYRASNAERMRKHNPMFNTKLAKQHSIYMKTMYQNGELVSPLSDPETHKKAASNNVMSQEAIHRASQRMIFQNPMKNPKVAHKMSETSRKRRDAGIIIDKRGQDHWLWKGNRDFNNTVRAQLHKSWIIPVMRRDEFKCTKCCSRNDLQVHHVKPLRWFLSFIKRKYKFSKYCDLSPKEKLVYSLEIVNMHRIEDGITVCEECHKKIDPYYRKGVTIPISGSVPLVPYREITQ